MTETTQIADAVKEILKQTDEGIVRWKMDTGEEPAHVTFGKNTLVDVVYWTTIDGQRLRIYGRSTPIYAGDEFFGYEEGVILEMTTDEGRLLWTFPYTPHTKALLQSVRHQASNADGFIKQMLTVNSEPDCDAARAMRF